MIWAQPYSRRTCQYLEQRERHDVRPPVDIDVAKMSIGVRLDIRTTFIAARRSGRFDGQQHSENRIGDHN